MRVNLIYSKMRLLFVLNGQIFFIFSLLFGCYINQLRLETKFCIMLSSSNKIRVPFLAGYYVYPIFTKKS